MPTHAVPMRAQSTPTGVCDSEDDSAVETSSVAWIEICRGRTQFPRRPIVADRFLIGAGSSCDLQLGGAGMPFLHSLIVRSPDSVTIEAFVPEPELRVNQAVVRMHALHDGDRLSIGEFEFAVHLQPSASAEPAESPYARIPLTVAEAPESEQVADLTAAELVERIEAAETEVRDYEQSQRAGVAALLNAARTATASPDTIEVESHDDEEAALLEELSSVSIELQQRLLDLRNREDAQRLRAEALLTAQDRLAEQLRLATQSLAQQQDGIRASA